MTVPKSSKQHMHHLTNDQQYPNRRRQPPPSGDRWPLEMRAETAAAYCDEPSVEAFKAKVAKRIYSDPVRGVGILPKWHRAKLDQDIARRHGLQADGVSLVEDVAGLI